MVVILGDNIIGENIKKYIERFNRQKKGAKLFFKKVTDTKQFGIGKFNHGKLIGINEKPKKAASHFACIGLYMYDHQVFDIIKNLKPSKRGELEITDVNNAYIAQKTATHEYVKGFWSDAGTFETLFGSAEFIRSKRKI